MKMEKENRSHRYGKKKDLGLNMDTNVVNKKVP